MITIKRLSKLTKTSKEQSFFVGDAEIKSDYADYKDDELVLFIPKGTQLQESFSKQNSLHRTKSYKKNGFYKTKEDIALPLRLVFPTEPAARDASGIKRRIPLVEGDYDFSELIGAKVERNTSVAENVSTDEQKDVQIGVSNEPMVDQKDEKMESQE